jgi:hypothetical protein
VVYSSPTCAGTGTAYFLLISLLLLVNGCEGGVIAIFDKHLARHIRHEFFGLAGVDGRGAGFLRDMHRYGEESTDWECTDLLLMFVLVLGSRFHAPAAACGCDDQQRE